MNDSSKKEIISLPQRNRRKINKSFISESEEEEDYVEKNISNNKEKLCENNFKKTYKYEYLDHTADVILHSYGNNLTECFESICISMFNYMCNLNNVKSKIRRNIIVKGDNLDDLLFNFLTEFHFLYGNEYFICNHIDIVKFDKQNFLIEAIGYGDFFNSSKHECGTEIKAITKHELKIISNNENCEIFVLVDI
ncbi:protein archease, putative [Plasmodium gallinaceum]|uniref:Protein archease-like n=1 Tax=Plasmodium gallinaceum TaxID=5849 RepID=A0A1J1GU23_PLAGA|nr:protein archease, putative [Plasmodium gallinaceum]CRG95793.1 protein archease, putative [Plasmodium gallinaceum]